MPTAQSWADRFQWEINRAEAARAKQNEGMARVCARRAAGIIIGEYLARCKLPDPGPSAYDRLRTLAQLPGISDDIRTIAGHFVTRIDVDHNLPGNANLIEEAQWLALALLGYAQSTNL